MEKNLQNIDEVLNRAYQSYEDEPSAGTWEKLSAALDKEDAEKYKRRFIGWKRIAVLLLFLLSGLLIYETRVVIKRKKETDLVKKISVSDSAFVSNKTNDYQKKSPVETKIIQQEAIKPLTTFENPGQLPTKEVLIEANENVLASPKSKQQIISVIEQSEVNIYSSKIKKPNKKSARSRAKTTIMPGVVAADDQESLAENIISKDKKSIVKMNDNLAANMTSIEKDTTINNFILPLASNKITETPKPFITDLVIKQPVLPAITTISGTAQSKEKKSPSSFRPFWSVTAFASSDWGQYKLDNDVQDNTGNQQDEKEEINHREKHEGSYSAGVLATRQFTKHFGLKTGMIYSNTAIGISPQEMYAAKKTDGSVAYKYITSSGYGFVKPGFGLPPAVGDSIQSTEAQHNLQVVSVPLMVSYRVEKNKFSISPAVGVSANFITRANVKTEVKDALNKEAVTINGLDGMKSFYTGLIADVSLQYNCNNRWSFNLLPTFKYALTPITKGNVVKTFPYSFSIGAGITYKF